MKAIAALCLTTLILGLAGDVLAGGGRGNIKKCQAAVQEKLRKVGITPADITSSNWRVDATRSHDDTNVWGYWYTFRPASCSQGEIVLHLGLGCGITDVSSRGGCSVSGLK